MAGALVVSVELDWKRFPLKCPLLESNFNFFPIMLTNGNAGQVGCQGLQ